MAEEIYRSVFEDIDTDKSGFLDRTELKAAIQKTFAKCGLACSEEALQFQMDKFDANHDGKISLAEYAKVLQETTHPKKA